MRGRLASLLRDPRWIGGGRVRAYAMILAAASAAFLVAGHLLVWRDGSDFAAFWSAGRLVLEGRPAAAYDAAAMVARHLAMGFTGGHPFLNPPPFLMVTAALGGLPYPAALAVWIVASYAAYAWALRGLPKPAFWPMLAFPGGVMAAMAGQTGLVTAALLIGAVGPSDRRKVLAGVLIGLMVIKPQLALLVPVALIAGREWRIFVVAGLTAASLLAASVAVFGIETLAAFLTNSSYAAGLARSDSEIVAKVASVMALGLQLGAPPAVAAAMQAGAAALAAWAVWRVWRTTREPLARLAILAAATPLATPYLLLYDLVILAAPLAWLGAEGMRRGFRPGERWALALGYAMPLAAFAAPVAAFVAPAWSLALMAAVLQRSARA